MLNFINQRIPVREDAEDVLLEVFTKIHTGIGKLQNEDRVKPWVFAITRNAVNDYWKKKYPTQSLDFEPPQEDEDALAHLETCLRNMIVALPEKYRKPLVLSEFQGFKQQEVAEKLGLGLSATKSRIQRGREKLKEAIVDCCNFRLNEKGQIMSGHDPDSCTHC